MAEQELQTPAEKNEQTAVSKKDATTVSDAAVAKGEEATGAKASKSRKKSKKSVPLAKVFIQASYNNTIVSVADDNGNVISWSSAGNCGFKGARKSTPYAAQVTAEKAMEKAEVFGVTEVNVYVKGVGSGRDQAVRGIVSRPNVSVLSINDITPIPHGGVRKKKVRRV